MIEEDVDFSKESGFSETDITRLYDAFKKVLNEQNEDYLDYVENEEESFEKTVQKIKWRSILQLCLKLLDLKDH